jgi:catechol 2,3-dioxygenase-like lactoylglutathione lyase family enzyme
MLLDGFNHVAVLTSDTDRLTAFYAEVFGSESEVLEENPFLKLTRIMVGPTQELNVFQISGNHEHEKQTPMFERGRLDHLALQASSMETFDIVRTRLMERGATDGFVTDFGPVLSLFFVDPDGLECEVCIPSPDYVPGVNHPPGTPSLRYHTAEEARPAPGPPS